MAHQVTRLLASPASRPGGVGGIWKPGGICRGVLENEATLEIEGAHLIHWARAGGRAQSGEVQRERDTQLRLLVLSSDN